eukprot:302460_1
MKMMLNGNRDNVAERRKANPELMNVFALSVAMSPSNVKEEAISAEIQPSSLPFPNNNTVTGESRTMQMDDDLFETDPNEIMMFAEEDFNMFGIHKRLQHSENEYLDVQVEDISKPIPIEKKEEHHRPHSVRLFWNYELSFKNDTWISLVIGNSGRLSWCFNSPYGKLCWRGTVRLKDLSDFPFGTLPAKWLPKKVQSLLRQFFREVKWISCDSGIGFQVPPKDMLIASVVPSAVKTFYNQIDFENISPEHVKEGNFVKKSPKLGVDRVLCLRASLALGAPLLVFDFGTAMTVSACDNNGIFVGGAILPGAKLQLDSLSSGTAKLLNLVLPEMPPDIFCFRTEDAIQSGVVNGISATARSFMRSWLAKWPQSRIIATGGDCSLILKVIAQQWEEQESIPFPTIHRCNYLIHVGIALHMHDLSVV